MGLLILGLVLFLLLVVLHEFGHFIAARRGNVEVEEFGIGFPPKLYGKKFKGHKTEYTLNLLPLGGFVRLKGEHDGDKGKGSYGSARLKTKVKIMLAGVGMNLVIAWAMLLILAVIGIPQLPLPGGEKQFSVASDSHETSKSLFVSYVEDGSPAKTAGLNVRDRILAIDNQSVTTEDALRQATESLAGQTVDITYLKDGQEGKISAALRTREEVEASRTTDDPKGYLGVLPYEYRVVRSTWSAPIVATGLTYQYTKITIQGLFSALRDLVVGNPGEASQNVSGPVGIFFVLRDGSALGYRYVLLIIALLSLTLAIMNALPIPALDGGRLFVTLLFRYLRRPLTPKIEERIHGTGFAALLLLFVVITVVDVRRFF